MPYLRTLIFHPLEKEPGSPLRIKAGQRIEAKTLGEAIHAAEQILHLEIIPHDPPKWFRVRGLLDQKESYGLVDIHILRGTENICPKQDLDFPLLDSDIVAIGALAC